MVGSEVEPSYQKQGVAVRRACDSLWLEVVPSQKESVDVLTARRRSRVGTRKLEPEEARAAKKRKYKLAKKAVEEQTWQQEFSMLGKRDRAPDVPFPMAYPEHELQAGSGMVVMEGGAEVWPVMGRTPSEGVLDSWVSEQMPHLIGQHPTTAGTTTTASVAHSSSLPPQTSAGPCADTCRIMSDEFVVEDISELSAAMEADEEEHREWEGKRVVMLNGKHAGRYGVVHGRTAKKYRIQLDGLPYALEFYAGSFALVQ